MRCKHETEERNLRLTREKADLTSSLAENEEELQEVMRRYKACVGAVSTDQITIQDQSLTIQTLECERNKLREQYAELCQRLDHMEGENVSTVQHKRLELKIRELESKLELERTTKTRMDTQIMRQKELIEKMNREMDDLRLREGTSQEDVKKVSRQLRYVEMTIVVCLISATLFLQRPEGGGGWCPVQGARAEPQEERPGEAARARRGGDTHRQERAQDRAETN